MKFDFKPAEDALKPIDTNSLLSEQDIKEIDTNLESLRFDFKHQDEILHPISDAISKVDDALKAEIKPIFGDDQQ